MQKHRKTIISILIGTLFIGLAWAGIHFYRNMNTVIKVYSVMDVMQENYEQNGSYGVITPGSSEAYRKSSTRVVEMYVKEGQEVNPGDALFRYDTQAVNTEKEKAANALTLKQLELQKAQAELDRWSRYVPYTPFEPYIVETETLINKESQPEKGDGTKEKPFHFVCGIDTKVLPSYLRWLYENEKVAEFTIWDSEDGGDMVAVFNWVVDGTQKPEVPPTPEPTPSEEVETEEEIIEPTPTPEIIDERQEAIDEIADATGLWEIADGLIRDHSGKVVEFQELKFAEGTSTNTSLPPAPSVSEARSHTREEIDEMVNMKRQEISRLRIEIMQAEVNVSKANQAASDGTVTTKCKGTIKKCEDWNSAMEGDTFLSVIADEGLILQSTIDELNLDSIHEGDPIEVTSFMTGTTAFGTISTISKTPTVNNAFGSMSEVNPNSSYYTFKATLDKDAELDPEDWVQVLFLSDESSDSFYLPKMFIRKENGKNYVYLANEASKLIKQEVQIGKTLYGEALEIKSGVTMEDYIAFPYGKGLKEGARCDLANGMEDLYAY